MLFPFLRNEEGLAKTESPASWEWNTGGGGRGLESGPPIIGMVWNSGRRSNMYKEPYGDVMEKPFSTGMSLTVTESKIQWWNG